MGKTIAFGMVVAILCVALGWIYGYYSSLTSTLKSNLQALQSSYEEILRSYQRIDEEYSGLLIKYSSLLNNHSSLLSGHRDLQNRYTGLLADYQRLSEDYQRLAGEYSKLVISYNALSSKYNALVADFENLGQRYRDLESRYATLSRQYDSLFKEKQRLEEDLRTFSNRYLSLQSQYNILYNEHQQLKDIAKTLNSSLTDVTNMLMKYCCIPYAFERALTLDKVYSVEPYVYSAGVYQYDFWSSIQNIYRWIRNNVKYVYDVPIPTRQYSICYSVEGARYCYYNFTEIRNYVQNPEFTARYGQGDCDDQAVLTYAMIRYYMRYIHDKEYDMWIASVVFNNRSSHLAVFIPVVGGRLAIVDPAGAYLTSTALGTITARPAYEELTRYSNWWINYDGIRTITLYRIDITSGKYVKLVEGDISTVSQFIALNSGS